MIRDDNHPRMQNAHKILLQRVGQVLGDGTKELTTGLLHDMFEVIKYHRAECRREHDLDFPALVVAAVPRLGIVHFMRADLDIVSLRQQIVNFVRMNPGVTKEETVNAFHMAYPDIKPGDILENKDGADKATERSVERAERIGEEAKQVLAETDESPMSSEDSTGLQSHERLSWEK